jgi:hypothetical protein
MVKAPVLQAVGLLTAWGTGGDALPADALAAAGGRAVLSLGRPAFDRDRLRRVPRECLLGLAAVEVMLQDACAQRGAIAGERTALLYASAGSYAASNRLFIDHGSGGAYFPYTAPAAVPAEVAIEFGITGPLAIFIGGPPTTLRAIWYAATLLEAAICERVLVLAVEIFEECADLYARGGRLTGHPLVEAAGCLWLEPGTGSLDIESRRGGGRPSRGGMRQRLGETFACEPVATLDLWRRRAASTPLCLSGAWSGEMVRLWWTDPLAAAHRRQSQTAGREGGGGLAGDPASCPREA